MKKKQRKSWKLCDVCYQLIYVDDVGTGTHRCPEVMRAKREAELDMILDEELSDWDMLVESFWKRKDVKFEQYLLRRDGN